MSDDDDFKALFFAECAELLTDLQDHLGTLSDGDGDAETVNAAFRAVHSVKGGAAAFGFNDLTGFAHEFETVMDRCRSGALSITPDLCLTLMRSGDVMELLVESARDGTKPTDPLIERVLSELSDWLEEGGSTARKAAAPAPDMEEPAIPTDDREVTITIAPLEDFFSSGQDIRRIVKAARDFGPTDVTCKGTVPPPDDGPLTACGLVWTLTITTNAPPSKLEEFVSFYELTADVTLDDEAPAPPDPVEELEPPALHEPEQEAAAPKAAEASSRAVQKSLRVELSRIDRLVNLVGEIVITQAALAQEIADIEARLDMEIPHSMEEMARQTRDLQESVMAIRAQPIKSVFSRMPRIVRDLADKLGKDVRLSLSGEGTEVDTTVIEELAEPLTHMLRNSMDHGIEPPDIRTAAGKPAEGTIELSAEHRGERVLIRLSDDGRGVDRERVLAKAIEKGLVSPDDQLQPEEIDQLIFHPGFSTAAVLSDVSGRGVGMDVVKKKIQSLGGRCTLQSTPGEGTVFLITLPLTLAVLDGMTIRVNDDRYILPLSTVVEALRVRDCKIETLPDGGQILARREGYIRLISVRNALDIPNTGTDQPEDMAIVIDTETEGHVALLVDELIGQRQVVLKSIEANFKQIDGVSGATILGDGRVALILDVSALAGLNRQRSAQRPVLTPVSQELEHVA
ncbi:two-component system chemotaxis sensor kinase CheA [Rubricella aquisinus]|uniref:Chemotaxis protein CheA n=1 Tax=Rubricella aquisinus TaxID=2028108 RepID=A0A840X4C5_9RHOB|nr:chemotaxis protein CheA [Rubricella aquisinus]MBB5516656.1 two-component system chemotaxis sensor kinase CheA [Rubricella aquisinus]